MAAMASTVRITTRYNNPDVSASGSTLPPDQAPEVFVKEHHSKRNSNRRFDEKLRPLHNQSKRRLDLIFSSAIYASQLRLVRDDTAWNLAHRRPQPISDRKTFDSLDALPLLLTQLSVISALKARLSTKDSNASSFSRGTNAGKHAAAPDGSDDCV